MKNQTFLSQIFSLLVQAFWVEWYKRIFQKPIAISPLYSSYINSIAVKLFDKGETCARGIELEGTVCSDLELAGRNGF